MSSRILLAVALAAFLFPLTPPAAAQPAEAAVFAIEVLLDPEKDVEVRREHFDRAVALAHAGSRSAQFLVGSLHRLGMDHPAQLMERSDSEAARYLSNAAVAGSVSAMAGMAELEIRRGNHLEAMLWAQLFSRYERESATPEGAFQRRQALAADLIRRASQALREEGEEQVTALFRRFLEQHDDRIMLALRSEALLEADPLLNPTRRLSPRRQGMAITAAAMSMDQPGSALFLIGVSPDGRIGKWLVVDSLPDARFARGLRVPMLRSRFNADRNADGLRWVLQPVSFDNGSVQIRPGG